jgi:hypothetical protein
MKNRKKILWLGVLALVVLHHDFWWWDDPTLVFGFLPIGLAYHVGFSIAACCARSTRARSARS